jgi:catechol 2,3-dioxygenase-like lactoylglutathione lyase family enzyme
MRIIKLAWVGTRTNNAESTVSFFRDVLGLRLELEQPGFWMLKLPDGSKVEVFGPASPINRHFTTGPVAGFLVDDIHAATTELRSADVEVLYESGVDDSGNAWVHFRAQTATCMSSPRTLASPDPTKIVAEARPAAIPPRHRREPLPSATFLRSGRCRRGVGGVGTVADGPIPMGGRER